MLIILEYGNGDAASALHLIANFFTAYRHNNDCDPPALYKEGVPMEFVQILEDVDWIILHSLDGTNKNRDPHGLPPKLLKTLARLLRNHWLIFAIRP